jgi:hypothetical protein
VCITFDRTTAESTVLMYFDIGMFADMKILNTCAASIFTSLNCVYVCENQRLHMVSKTRRRSFGRLSCLPEELHCPSALMNTGISQPSSRLCSKSHSLILTFRTWNLIARTLKVLAHSRQVALGLSGHFRSLPNQYHSNYRKWPSRSSFFFLI